jgi:uncharacterized protein with HEPN domain
MSERGDSDLLKDMREAVRRIKAYTRAMSYDGFMTDTRTQDAVVRNLEIIGEAAKAVSAELKDSHPGMPWKGMAGTRDRLIHHYFGINLDIVWDIVTVELPSLEKQIEAILH